MIGATVGKEPDFIQDEDLKTPAQLRAGMKSLEKARMSLNEKATLAGVMANQDVLRQQLEMTHEQLRRMIGMYQTLQNEFTAFKNQRITELNMKVNGGSTTPGE